MKFNKAAIIYSEGKFFSTPRRSLCWYRIVAALGVAAALLGYACEGVSWPNPQVIDSLRILGVRAEPASLSPGQSTELSVICADGSREITEEPTCEVEIAWFADCNNPDNNDPDNCLDQYTAGSDALASPLADTPTDGSLRGFHFGQTLEFVSPQNILTKEVQFEENTIKYGISYIYFAVCAGRLYPVINAVDRLPVECRDPDSGKRLGQSRFVVGITTIYSYDLIVNRNPQVAKASFDGVTIETNCSAEEDCPEGLECSSDKQCVPVVERCAKDNPDGCREHCLRLTLDPTSFNLFTKDGTMLDAPLKSLWCNSFTNSRHLPDNEDSPKCALVDRDGRIRKRTPCIDWIAPRLATDHAHLWVVFRDNRGGLTAWDQRILVR